MFKYEINLLSFLQTVGLFGSSSLEQQFHLMLTSQGIILSEEPHLTTGLEPLLLYF